MSHVKAGGSSKNIHNNAGARLGVKRFGGQKVNAGEVLVRDRHVPGGVRLSCSWRQNVREAPASGPWLTTSHLKPPSFS